MSNNITYTINNKLCTGCGICEDVCPKQAINIVRINGEHRPYLDSGLCLGDKCGRCLKVCPGVGINFSEASSCFSDKTIKIDKYIGRYVGLYTGYSTDYEIRYHSASGGMVSQFLIYLLEKRIIDGAVVTGFSDTDHITPVSYIARNREDVLLARSSKYCPVALNKVGNEIVDLEGRYVIVGLPCHIQGFRKRAAIDRKFRERVVGYFSIYCSSNRTFNAQDYIFYHWDIKKHDINDFAYRDEGCLGNMIVKSKGKSISVPYTSYYGPLLRSFFKTHRCMTCIDHYGELADVSFGDIHISPYDEDKIGISSWIVRSDYWEKLFFQCAQEGYITLNSLDEKTLNDSQGAMLYPKRKRAKVVMNIDKLFCRAVPQYDKTLESPALKDYLSEIICYAQMFIGRRKSLWWIIDLLSRHKYDD